MERIPERDWKKLRAMQDRGLDATCARIFEKVQQIIDNREGRNYAAYLGLFKLIEDEDKQIGLMFNNMRRSTAIWELLAWKANGLLTQEDLQEFSDETRRVLQFLDR